MDLLILLQLHLIGDFVLQNDFLANTKGSNKFILFVHSSLWAGSIAIGLNAMGLLSPWKLVFLIVGHMIIDQVKCNKKDKTYALTRDLYIDQICHVIQILIVYWMN